MKLNIVVLVLILCTAAASAQSAMEKQLFDLVNRERARAGRSTLEWNDDLARAALKHSQLLAAHQDLSHQFGGEPSLQERVGATGARFNSAAENVAQAPDVITAHQGLMHSTGHRENILNPDYNGIGIAIVQRGQELFITQDFAHILTSYTEKQFQNALITSFNKARRANRLQPVKVVSDARLHKAACAHDMDTDKMIKGLSGVARLLVFTMSGPGRLPNDLRKAAADKTIQKMNLGVCLQTGGSNGFSRFWVVAAFYRATERDADE
ncbi:MAG TPA: CAP domain-containing protein [Candidatus Angelobacter sp.]|nr:CAP domain-containing protein [Candidatus Angelobacter sp.]